MVLFYTGSWLGAEEVIILLPIKFTYCNHLSGKRPKNASWMPSRALSYNLNSKIAKETDVLTQYEVLVLVLLGVECVIGHFIAPHTVLHGRMDNHL
jgi:hypothetical protein